MNAEQRMSIQQAQAGWSQQPLARRLSIVRRLRHLLAAHGHELAATIRTIRQSSLHEALASEVLPVADACRFLERNAHKLLRPERLQGSGPLWLGRVRTTIHREPLGIVLILGPRNYPLFLPCVQALQALVAGNAVLLKPALGCRAVVEQFSALLRQAGLDPRLLTILDEAPSSATTAITLGVDKVLLTGHVHTGQQVLAQLASRIVPATVELSGCDAAFVLPQADIERTARALSFGLRWNHSATCIAPRRVFVAADYLQGLEQALLAIHREQHPRATPSLDTAQSALVHDALAQGAKLLLGRPEAPPVILSRVPTTARLLREEIFAPVLSLFAVHGTDEALALAAECPFRLGASVFGPSTLAREFAQQIDAGCITINDAIVPTADPRVPFGGRGLSGFGVTRGAEGLRQLTTIKVVAERRRGARHLDETNFADHLLLQHYLAAAHGPSWWGRLRAWGRLLRHLVQRRSNSQEVSE